MQKTDKYLGLTEEQARQRLEQYGKNELTPQKKKSLFSKIIDVISEPMFILLLMAALIYFFLGQIKDGSVMLCFVVATITVEIFQELKTDRTLEALKELSAPKVSVMRNGEVCEIQSENLVVGDLMLLYEGVKVPADGKILSCDDLCADESSLTGESAAVEKRPFDSQTESDEHFRQDHVYASTLITRGSAKVLVTKTAAATEYGKIGLGIAKAPYSPTPLQRQISRLVKWCAALAAVLFVSVFLLAFFNNPDIQVKSRLIQALLSALTLAMAMIPEEFPVILTVFLSLGAGRLARQHSLVRRLPAVETLGAVSVLCVDKTGTVTMNKMHVEKLWAPISRDSLMQNALSACESLSYDAMENAIIIKAEEDGIDTDKVLSAEMTKEYSFTNESKMMAHARRIGEKIVLSAKGSPEEILKICEMSQNERLACEQTLQEMSSEALRVIAVARSEYENEADLPESLGSARLSFLGLIGLMDPIRENVIQQIAVLKKAGVRVVMITGDSAATAQAIADKLGIEHTSPAVTGNMLEQASEQELTEMVRKASIFCRVIPEHKMKIVKALKSCGETVAMTGDGVNDAPALKYADIGVAMGMRGSQVAREAADLILMDDNFATITSTIADGRRIYDNIKRAVGYVFSIHIPIALASLASPLLGLQAQQAFLLPIYVAAMELLIDPTCSVVLERIPAEEGIMERPPRSAGEPVVSFKYLFKNVVQGLGLFIASFGLFLYTLKTRDVFQARSIGLSVLFLGNLMLVYTNCSQKAYAWESIKRLCSDKLMWAASLSVIGALLIIVYSPLNTFLKLAPLSAAQLVAAVICSAAAVMWTDLIKLIKRSRPKASRKA